MDLRNVPEGVSDLRYTVDMLLKDYHAESVLQMLVHAIEDLGPSGALDPEGSLPRAGNWCGLYTCLFTPIVLTMGFKEKQPKPKRKWFSHESEA